MFAYYNGNQARHLILYIIFIYLLNFEVLKIVTKKQNATHDKNTTNIKMAIQISITIGLFIKKIQTTNPPK